ncbi:MAG: bifunctional hydroxymethylpyrimidine kinase/phosphomethylpyrimidine kinase [Myxococcota bacterium]
MSDETPTRRPVPTALTIAGSDPSGGAGLQADLKTFHQHGVYGMAVVTLLTVQNTRSVSRVEVMPADLVRQQLEAVLADVPPRAVKTGALGNAEVIRAVAGMRFGAPLVVDPVMVSKHGHALMAPDAKDALLSLLLPVTTLLTPNTQEAAAMLGAPVETLAQAEAAAEALSRLGPTAVLVKGGHLTGPESIDVLFHAGRVTRFEAPRVDTRHTHGTGCTYSAAITAGLAAGLPLELAVARAKAWLTSALLTPPDIGGGIGPVDHFAATFRAG